MDTGWRRRLVVLGRRILDTFENSDWDNVEQLRQQSEVLRYYPKLLLNLAKENEGYPSEVVSILRFIATNDQGAFSRLESYVVLRSLDRREHRRASVPPRVFGIPELPVVPDLVAVAMPLRKDFARVFETVETACGSAQLQCRRGYDIWEDSAVLQDAFNLVFHSRIIIADFTSKDANVMYAAGIAHTLGRHVIPLSQSLDDVPYDLLPQRILKYSVDPDGLLTLQSRLEDKLRQITAPPAEQVRVTEDTGPDTANVVPIRQRSSDR